jgi:hypothetical protein
MAMRKSPGPMHSRAQWRFLYATKKPFAHKWAEKIEATRGVKTGYRSLPERVHAVRGRRTGR